MNNADTIFTPEVVLQLQRYDWFAWAHCRADVLPGRDYNGAMDVRVTFPDGRSYCVYVQRRPEGCRVSA